MPEFTGLSVAKLTYVGCLKVSVFLKFETVNAGAVFIEDKNRSPLFNVTPLH